MVVAFFYIHNTFFFLHAQSQNHLFPYGLEGTKKKIKAQLLENRFLLLHSLSIVHMIVARFIYGYRFGIVHCVPIDTIAQEFFFLYFFLFSLNLMCFFHFVAGIWFYLWLYIAIHFATSTSPVFRE